MKKLFMLALALTASLFGAYQVGEQVPDFSFQDTNLDGTTITTYDHNLTDLTGTQKKVLFMNFFYPT